MARIFDRNLFIMLFSVMIGVVVITYFLADIVNQTKIDQLTARHTVEIENIEEMNINFTNNFLESSVLLDSAREFRAFGNYHFDLASLFYTSALSEKNISKIYDYKNRSIDNSSNAMPKYLNSYLNFKSASDFFNNTKKHTTYDNYLELLDLYVKLTNSGAILTMLRYNASMYLKYLAENITIQNGAAFVTNETGLMDLLNMTLMMYGVEAGNYDDIEQDIAEYDIKGFSPNREPT
ncbi:MAG: hypothetical protein JXA91_05290 [Candidatus Thermoplasmatota archaeon]|nr:hypothetical protein [Candidatus Thermoplasmatota archaeon]